MATITKIEIENFECKSADRADEQRTFDKGQVDMVTVAGTTFARVVFQPGWRWSDSVKPIVNTESCEIPHLQYHIKGRLHVRMDDGTELEFRPGDVSSIPAGHDAWVVGEEACEMIAIEGMVDYAKKPEL